MPDAPATDVIDQLRRYGEATEAAVPAAPAVEPRPRRHRALLAAVLVVVACVGAALWALQADGDSSGPTVDTIDDPPAPTGWQSLDPGPLRPREGSAVVWTGEELVVWGGTRTESGAGFADGAAYDPVTGEWRMMSAPPVARGGVVGGVWTGEEVVVWSAEATGEGDDLAPWAVLAWDPATDEWRTAGGRCLVGTVVGRCPEAMPQRPVGFDALEPAWSGEELLDIGIGAAYDPDADVWRTLPERPIVGTPNAATWTGDELVVLVANRSDPSYPAGEAVALAYDPTSNGWEALPATGIGENGVDVAWDGERLVALDYSMQAAAYRPGDDAWEALPPLPLRFYECLPRLAPIAGTLLADHCSGQALLTESDEWAIAPPPSSAWGTLVPTEEALLSWWSSDYYGDPPGSALRSYRPRPVTDGDLALERTIPVGTVRLDLPEGARLTGTSLAPEAGGLVTEIGFELTLEDGTACSLRSTYAGIRSEIRIRDDAAETDAEISRMPLAGVDVDRDRALVARFVAGSFDEQAHILLEESTSDVLDIACPDLATAETLLSRTHR